MGWEPWGHSSSIISCRAQGFSSLRLLLRFSCQRPSYCVILWPTAGHGHQPGMRVVSGVILYRALQIKPTCSQSRRVSRCPSPWPAEALASSERNLAWGWPFLPAASSPQMVYITWGCVGASPLLVTAKPFSEAQEPQLWSTRHTPCAAAKG